MTLAAIDYVILALYFAFVLGIGWHLRKKIATSGVYTSAESLSVHLTGTFTATRFYSIPASAGTGTLTILATAAAGGATGNGETRVAVADTVPPVITQFSVSPADSAQPGDSLTVTLTMGDNAALRYSIIRLSGPVTLKDSVDHAYAPYASHILRLRLRRVFPLSVFSHMVAMSGTACVSVRSRC